MFLQIIFTVCRNGDECVQLLLFFDIHLTAYIPNSTNNILQDCHSLFCDSVFKSFVCRWPCTPSKTLAAHVFLYVDFVFMNNPFQIMPQFLCNKRHKRMQEV